MVCYAQSFLFFLIILISCCDISCVNKKIQASVLYDFSLNELKKNGKELTAISMAEQCKTTSPIYVYNGTNGFHEKIHINQNSLFQTGSITKSFISVVVLQIAEENGLDSDSDSVISKYFPEYPKWGEVTLRQLMNMTSGIPGSGTIKGEDIFRRFTKKRV
jgi:hypothetical protein